MSASLHVCKSSSLQVILEVDPQVSDLEIEFSIESHEPNFVLFVFPISGEKPAHRTGIAL